MIYPLCLDLNQTTALGGFCFVSFPTTQPLGCFISPCGGCCIGLSGGFTAPSQSITHQSPHWLFFLDAFAAMSCRPLSPISGKPFDTVGHEPG